MTDSSLESTSGDDEQQEASAPENGDDVRFVEGDDELLSNRYRIDSTLGEGAMGKVFRGEHVMMEKTVAIKVLHQQMLDNEEMIARFQREARAAAALDHPNVCQATDFGQRDDGSFFLVMEYLEGQTLKEVIAEEGQLELDRALHIARQTASALADAHDRGIVHRDLKPENIMLIERGGQADTVKIMDFGIARLIASAQEDEDGEQTRLTREGMIYGTPHYMSPEQVAGDDVDARTDLYALGVVLFEMLAGQPPYDGDNIARVMGKHITQPIPSVSEHCDVPSPLDLLLNTLLAKDADDRPPDASAVIESIAAVADYEPGAADNITRRIDDAVHKARSSGKKAAEAIGPGVESAAESIGPAAKKAADSIAPVAQSTLETAKVGSRKVIEHAGAGATTLITKFGEAGVGLWDFWAGLPKTERRIAAALTMMVMVMSVLAVAVFSFVISGERQAAAIDDQREALLEDEEIADAVERAEAGDRSALDEFLEEDPDNPHLRYLALDANLQANRSVDIVDEAAGIIDLDSRYAHDPLLVRQLGDRLTSSSDGDDAQALIAEHINPTFRDDLAERARVASSGSMRDAAYELLEETGEFRRLDRWEQITAEMRQTSNCEKLEEKLEQIRSIGDARAIPTLEAYQNKPRRGCGTLNLRDCISCIRGDLGDVIDELRGE